MSLADSNDGVPYDGAPKGGALKNAVFMSMLNKQIARGKAPPVPKQVPETDPNITKKIAEGRAKLKFNISSIRQHLDALENVADSTDIDIFCNTSTRVCYEIRECVIQLEYATGAVERPALYLYRDTLPPYRGH
jgi:hypothetical protein